MRSEDEIGWVRALGAGAAGPTKGEFNTVEVTWKSVFSTRKLLHIHRN